MICTHSPEFCPAQPPTVPIINQLVGWSEKLLVPIIEFFQVMPIWRKKSMFSQLRDQLGV